MRIVDLFDLDDEAARHYFAILKGERMFRAMGDRIFIKADPAQEKAGSIFLPPGAANRMRKEAGLTGIVRHIGPGMLMKNGERWPMPDIRVGDRVIYLDQPWPVVKIGDEELISLRDDGLLAVVES